MQLDLFMNEAFPNLKLSPPLFYKWPIGIRFELGVEWTGEGDDAPGSLYLTNCYKRVVSLFEALHKPMDELFVVMDVIDVTQGKGIGRKLKNFSPYVEKSLLYRLKHQIIPWDVQEDGDGRTHRFTLKCTAAEIGYKPLLKAVCQWDLGIKPSIPHRVYFVHIQQKTIFHVYDDRGCDVIASLPDTIRALYEKYNHWILDYDRAEIDKVFK